jgi:alpha-L-glutamate ligase-like protein
MPENYLTIKTNGEMRFIWDKMAQLKSFVIKPARGSQGNGILVIKSVEVNEDTQSMSFISSRGEKRRSDIRYHISSILSGLYSLNGTQDAAIIQEKLDIHPMFLEISDSGIPDIRVIIYKGFPVMSMVRVPTYESGGRANLHQGAIGCGIRIRNGSITKVVHKNRVITEHPDSKVSLEGMIIPHWEDVLKVAARCYDITGLGYQGIDIVLDPLRGPLLLEMNARPGLAIQTANLKGLIPRLDLIDTQDASINFEEKVKISMGLF